MKKFKFPEKLWEILMLSMIYSEWSSCYARLKEFSWHKNNFWLSHSKLFKQRYFSLSVDCRAAWWQKAFRTDRKYWFLPYDKNMANNKNKVSLSLDSLSHSISTRVDWRKIFFFLTSSANFSINIFSGWQQPQKRMRWSSEREKLCYF